MHLDLSAPGTRPPPRLATLILFAIALTQLLAASILNISALTFTELPFVWLQMALSCYVIPLTLTASLIGLVRHYQVQSQLRPRHSWLVWTNAVLNFSIPLITMIIAYTTD